MKKALLTLFNSRLLQKPMLAYKSTLPRIAYYHIVSDATDIPYYYKQNVFTGKILHEQLSWFKKQGYAFITLDEAHWLVENNERAPKTLAFTTDDGFKENYTVMAPVFNEFGIKPTLFLLSNCLNNNDMMWGNKIYYISRKAQAEKQGRICSEIARRYKLGNPGTNLKAFSQTWPMVLKDEIANFAWELAGLPPLKQFLSEQRPYLSNAQVKELIGAGYSIGSHSMSHPEFSKLTLEEARNEMLGSKKTLSETFQTDVHYFSYPYGKRPAAQEVETEMVQSGAYKLLFGTKSNLSNTQQNRVWERDKMEQDHDRGKFWFATVPVLRNTVLRPLGLYL